MSSATWAYIRVSGDAQADRGLPVAGQRRALADCREQFHVLTSLADKDTPSHQTILLRS